MNRWTTCRALGGKCGFFGARGFALSACRRSLSARAPKPTPERTSRSRRESMAESDRTEGSVLDHVAGLLDPQAVQDPFRPVHEHAKLAVHGDKPPPLGDPHLGVFHAERVDAGGDAVS